MCLLPALSHNVSANGMPASQYWDAAGLRLTCGGRSNPTKDQFPCCLIRAADDASLLDSSMVRRRRYREQSGDQPMPKVLA